MEAKIMVPSGGASAGQAARRFRVGGVPPLAEGFTGRPDTAPGIVEALAPGSAVVLVPGSAFAEGPENWLGACGTSQPWLVVLDDLQDPADLDGLWPEGPEGRLLVTSRQSTLASGRPGMRVGA